jgi:hypothetical protein
MTLSEDPNQDPEAGEFKIFSNVKWKLMNHFSAHEATARAQAEVQVAAVAAVEAIQDQVNY